MLLLSCNFDISSNMVTSRLWLTTKGRSRATSTVFGALTCDNDLCLRRGSRHCNASVACSTSASVDISPLTGVGTFVAEAVFPAFSSSAEVVEMLSACICPLQSIWSGRLRHFSVTSRSRNNSSNNHHSHIMITILQSKVLIIQHD